MNVSSAASPIQTAPAPTQSLTRRKKHHTAPAPAGPTLSTPTPATSKAKLDVRA
jgi:hypothetical protein